LKVIVVLWLLSKHWNLPFSNINRVRTLIPFNGYEIQWPVNNLKIINISLKIKICSLSLCVLCEVTDLFLDRELVIADFNISSCGLLICYYLLYPCTLLIYVHASGNLCKIILNLLFSLHLKWYGCVTVWSYYLIFKYGSTRSAVLPNII